MQAGASALLQDLFNDYLLLRLDTKQRYSTKGKPKEGAAHGPTADLPVRPSTHCISGSSETLSLTAIPWCDIFREQWRCGVGAAF